MRSSWNFDTIRIAVMLLTNRVNTTPTADECKKERKLAVNAGKIVHPQLVAS
ncbi:hypothetical protein HanRHA438_Chr13g0617641 [Helianthus annuus]|nr:hypothetical protein HanRHA438_Chr13g0617641 [Helianthus annuus]